jgi:hypothetical protein
MLGAVSRAASLPLGILIACLHPPLPLPVFLNSKLGRGKDCMRRQSEDRLPDQRMAARSQEITNSSRLLRDGRDSCHRVHRTSKPGKNPPPGDIHFLLQAFQALRLQCGLQCLLTRERDQSTARPSISDPRHYRLRALTSPTRVTRRRTTLRADHPWTRPALCFRTLPLCRSLANTYTPTLLQNRAALLALGFGGCPQKFHLWRH